MPPLAPRKMITIQHRSQNFMFCMLITMLGVIANVLNTVVDRIALSYDQQAMMAGLYISVYATGSLTSVTLSSALADVIGKRTVIAVALLFMILGILLLALSQSFALALVSLFFIGFGFGPSEAMSSALLNDDNPLQASRWMNISQAGFSLGSILAPILTMAYLSLGRSYRQVFLICGFIFVLIFIRILQTSKGSIMWPKSNISIPLHMFTVLKSGRIRLYALMIFCYLGYESVAPPYIKQLFLQTGQRENLAAFMISLFWISMIVSRLIGTLLANREMPAIKVFTSFVIMGFLLMVFARSMAVRIVGVILLGFGCGPVWPMLLVLAVREFPQRSGSAIGVMMIFSTAGISIFPFLIGTLANSLTITFSLCVVLGLLVFVTAFKAGRLNYEKSSS